MNNSGYVLVLVSFSLKIKCNIATLLIKTGFISEELTPIILLPYTYQCLTFFLP